MTSPQTTEKESSMRFLLARATTMSQDLITWVPPPSLSMRVTQLSPNWSSLPTNNNLWWPRLCLARVSWDSTMLKWVKISTEKRMKAITIIIMPSRGESAITSMTKTHSTPATTSPSKFLQKSPQICLPNKWKSSDTTKERRRRTERISLEMSSKWTLTGVASLKPWVLLALCWAIIVNLDIIRVGILKVFPIMYEMCGCYIVCVCVSHYE